jgi:hypothetical protein
MPIKFTAHSCIPLWTMNMIKIALSWELALPDLSQPVNGRRRKHGGPKRAGQSISVLR